MKTAQRVQLFPYVEIFSFCIFSFSRRRGLNTTKRVSPEKYIPEETLFPYCNPIKLAA
jgi:hypothetical protein